MQPTPAPPSTHNSPHTTDHTLVTALIAAGLVLAVLFGLAAIMMALGWVHMAAWPGMGSMMNTFATGTSTVCR